MFSSIDHKKMSFSKFKDIMIQKMQKKGESTRLDIILILKGQSFACNGLCDLEL